MQSSFLVKRESGRVQFSTEKYNLTAQNSFKFQGIANGKAVDISQHYDKADKEQKNPKGISLSAKSPKGINAPVSHQSFCYILTCRFTLLLSPSLSLISVSLKPHYSTMWSLCSDVVFVCGKGLAAGVVSATALCFCQHMVCSQCSSFEQSSSLHSVQSTQSKLAPQNPE